MLAELSLFHCKYRATLLSRETSLGGKVSQRHEEGKPLGQKQFETAVDFKTAVTGKLKRPFFSLEMNLITRVEQWREGLVLCYSSLHQGLSIVLLGRFRKILSWGVKECFLEEKKTRLEKMITARGMSDSATLNRSLQNRWSCAALPHILFTKLASHTHHSGQVPLAQWSFILWILGFKNWKSSKEFYVFQNTENLFSFRCSL